MKSSMSVKKCCITNPIRKTLYVDMTKENEMINSLLQSLKSENTSENTSVCLCKIENSYFSDIINKSNHKSNVNECACEMKDNMKSISHQVEYEVEHILDYKKSKNQDLYLVKWKGWTHSSNTWEPLHNLKNCRKLLINFWRRRDENCEMNRNIAKTKIANILSKIDSEQKFDQNLKKPTLQFLALMKKINKIKNNIKTSCTTNNLRKTKSFLSLLSFNEIILLPVLEFRRQKLKHELKIWENQINSLSEDFASICIENNTDLEGPPLSLTYPGNGVTIPDDPLVGCECNCCYKDRISCCAAQFGNHFAYNKWKRLQIAPGSPIYECNKRCCCLNDCINRVVQQGRKVKLCIFRTFDGRGWGVKALELIKKNTFVTEYVGEVITNEEAELRGQKYDAEGRTYLFDLDYNDGDNPPFTVDAAYYGNISHFINHSCDPNLSVFGVYINCLEPNLPRIALFSRKDIKKGEEITFDYLAQHIQDSKLSKSPRASRIRQVPVQLRTTCKCGTEKCRRYLF